MNRKDIAAKIIKGATIHRIADRIILETRQNAIEQQTSENSVWPARLKLTPNQVKYLLIAAAEYRDLTAESGEAESAVGFVDWMAVDALRPEPWDKTPVSEGAPAHNINGDVAVMQHKGDIHRHPFPMPVASSGERHTRGMRHR